MGMESFGGIPQNKNEQEVKKDLVEDVIENIETYKETENLKNQETSETSETSESLLNEGLSEQLQERLNTSKEKIKGIIGRYQKLTNEKKLLYKEKIREKYEKLSFIGIGAGLGTFGLSVIANAVETVNASGIANYEVSSLPNQIMIATGIITALLIVVNKKLESDLPSLDPVKDLERNVEDLNKDLEESIISAENSLN